MNNTELEVIYQEDQMDRHKFLEENPHLIERDHTRRSKVSKLLEKRLLKTVRDFANAALIFHHGKTVQDYQKALDLCQKSLDLGLPPYESLYPQIIDRLQIQQQVDAGIPRKSAKQRFGTQMKWFENGNVIYFYPLDGSVTDEELKLYGLPNSQIYNGKPYQEYEKAFKKARDAARIKSWGKSN